jgi:hypothetical protein
MRSECWIRPAVARGATSVDRLLVLQDHAGKPLAEVVGQLPGQPAPLDLLRGERAAVLFPGLG